MNTIKKDLTNQKFYFINNYLLKIYLINYNYNYNKYIL